MHLGCAQIRLQVFKLPSSQTGTTASSALLALMGQEEGRIRWLGQADRKETARGRLLTNESRQVTFTNAKG